MSMFELLGEPACFPFAVALVVMLGIALLEGITSLLGFAASSFLDAVIPEVDLDIDADVDLDIDADADLDIHGVAGPGTLTQTLSWLRVGQVPVLVLLIVFLAAFGLIGLFLQSLMIGVLGRVLPGLIMSVPAFLGALPIVRLVGGVIAKILPKEETSAVSRLTFVGRVAHIVLGTARSGEPTQARVRDEHGRVHYVMVEPDIDGEEFSAGDPVLLVRAEGARFRIIRPSSESLLKSEAGDS